MDTSTKTTITINGKEYELLLTVQAISDIYKKYGGLEAYMRKMANTAADDPAIIDELAYAIALLANQVIEQHNFTCNAAERKPLLTEKEVLLFTPLDGLAEVASIVARTLNAGIKRNIKSAGVAEDEENPPTASRGKQD